MQITANDRPCLQARPGAESTSAAASRQHVRALVACTCFRRHELSESSRAGHQVCRCGSASPGGDPSISRSSMALAVSTLGLKEDRTTGTSFPQTRSRRCRTNAHTQPLHNPRPRCEALSRPLGSCPRMLATLRAIAAACSCPTQNLNLRRDVQKCSRQPHESPKPRPLGEGFAGGRSQSVLG